MNQLNHPPMHLLIDLENIGNDWKEFAAVAEPGDTVHLFFSNKSVKIGIQDLGGAPTKNNVNFQFHECVNGTPNAMDFQIMFELGRLTVQRPNDRYAIITYDTGFMAVVPYARTCGCDVYCIAQDDEGTPVNERKAEKSDLPPPAMPAGQMPSKRKSGFFTGAFASAAASLSVPAPEKKTSYREILTSAGVPKQEQPILASILYESMLKPANKRKLDCYNRILKHYGHTDGNMIYTSLKPLIHKIADEGPWPDQQSGQDLTNQITSAVQTAVSQAAGQPAAQMLSRSLAEMSNTVTDAATIASIQFAMEHDGGMKTSKKLATKIRDMIAAARETTNPRQSLDSRLMNHYKNRKDTDKALKALNKFLK